MRPEFEQSLKKGSFGVHQDFVIVLVAAAKHSEEAGTNGKRNGQSVQGAFRRITLSNAQRAGKRT